MLQLHNRWKNSAFKAEPNFNLKVSIKHQIQASVDVGLHLNLGKDPATKSDEFLENFQTAFDPPSFSENYIAYIANFLGPRGPLVLPSVGPSVPSRPSRPSRKKNLDHYIQAYMPYES